MKLRQTMDITDELTKILALYKQKPYLPVWGELFCILWNVKRAAQRSNCDILAYSIHPTGQLIYQHKEGIFVAHLPECNIRMSLDELLSMLLKNCFQPTNKNPKSFTI